MGLLHRRTATATDGLIVNLSPEGAGWNHCGLQVFALAAGASRTVQTGGSEAFVLPLSGSVVVDVDGETFQLDGRRSVFERVTDFAYVGRDSTVVVASRSGAEVALPSARCETKRPAKYGPAAEVPVEVRGAGSATRQVTNFGVPGVWDHAERLICCELLTPPGNWSSYPPHKHDITAPCPVVNEEIYYYRIAGRDQLTPAAEGFGYHRTYTGDEHLAAGLPALDEAIEVHDHDTVAIPYGYHGPCIAAPDYPMYYLNVMAGPGPRAMAFCDDPAHSWIRDGWSGQALDPRCPLTSASGRVDTPERLS